MKAISQSTLSLLDYKLPSIYMMNCSTLINHYYPFCLKTIKLENTLSSCKSKNILTWESVSFEYRSMAQRDCIGSMIFSEELQARAKRVVLEYISMVRLKACWAPSVILKDVRTQLLCISILIWYPPPVILLRQVSPYIVLYYILVHYEVFM